MNFGNGFLIKITKEEALAGPRSGVACVPCDDSHYSSRVACYMGFLELLKRR